MPTSKTKARGLKELALQELRTCALVLLFESKINWTISAFENHSYIKNFLVTFFLFFKHFHQFWNLSDKISLIKWISRCLFTENIMFRAVIGSHKIFCYIILHPGRDFFSLLSTHASALRCYRLTRRASSLAWPVGK